MVCKPCRETRHKDCPELKRDRTLAPHGGQLCDCAHMARGEDGSMHMTFEAAAAQADPLKVARMRAHADAQAAALPEPMRTRRAEGG